MPFKRSVAAELPYLRRYARTVTGASDLGDAAVRETLEALLESPREFDVTRPPRPELYRVFHHLWRSETISALRSSGPIAHLTPRSRQALLLTAVEGFSVDEAAGILAISPDEVRDDIEEARTHLADELCSDVMIIEDEAIVALHVKSIVREIGHKVIGVSRTRTEAVEMAQETEPELVLADICLADGSSGIDAVKDILASIDVPVIFVTAFPERLLTGERPEPTYLITKPFDAAVLTATIAQALLFHRESKALTGDRAAA
jgi:DNA-directed RNA polymerase specialized sigma24 family protein/CheY-like chemotaxis protein